MSRPSTSSLLPRTYDDSLVEASPEDLDDDDSQLKMGVSLSTAKWLAPSTAAFNIGCQLYGMLSSPNMKEIADRNHAMFSPQPMFIAGFFFPQIVIQALWMYKEFYEGRAKRETLDYVPIFALGEVAIGLWMVFWNNERFVASQICVMINSLSQLYAITQLPARRQGNQLTHLVANMFAGIGVLDLLDNGAVAFFLRSKPNNLVKAITAVGFPALALSTNPIFGASLIFDTAALYYGQSGSWQTVLGWTSVATVASVFAGAALRGGQ